MAASPWILGKAWPGGEAFAAAVGLDLRYSISITYENTAKILDWVLLPGSRLLSALMSISSTLCVRVAIKHGGDTRFGSCYIIRCVLTPFFPSKPDLAYGSTVHVISINMNRNVREWGSQNCDLTPPAEGGGTANPRGRHMEKILQEWRPSRVGRASDGDVYTHRISLSQATWRKVLSMRTLSRT